MTKIEIVRDEQMQRVFEQFEGPLDIDKLNFMFMHYGVEVPRRDLVRFFNSFDKDQNGNLDLNEFKTLAMEPNS